MLRPVAAAEMYAASHKALQAAMDKCADNVEHLADFVPVLLQQMSGGQRLVAAARTTLNVMLSSESTLKEDIPLSVIEFFLGGIDTDPPAREEYINCLAKLLTNKGVGIKRNQDTILDRWLLNKRRSQLIYDTISPEKGIVQVRIRPEPSATPHGKPGGDMSANQRAQHGGSSGLQAKSAPAWGSGTVRVIDLEALTSSLQDKQLYAVYLGQLELLHKLCLGCNKDARALIGGLPRLRARACSRSCAALGPWLLTAKPATSLTLMHGRRAAEARDVRRAVPVHSQRAAASHAALPLHAPHVQPLRRGPSSGSSEQLQ